MVVARTLCWPVTRIAVRTLTTLLHRDEHSAPLAPCRLIDVDPDSICVAARDKPDTTVPFISSVEGGDWDRNTRKIADDVVYRAFERHFEAGVPWEETEYHQFMIDRLDDTAIEWRKYRSMEDVRERYESLDNLYENIATNGYMAQEDLLETNGLVEFPEDGLLGAMIPPELREVTVDVARDGQFVWAAGMHRLCMAKVLDVPSIPVRVRVRHRQWQQRRDTVAEESDSATSHPDMTDL